MALMECARWFVSQDGMPKSKEFQGGVITTLVLAPSVFWAFKRHGKLLLLFVVSHIQRIGCQPEKTTLHGGQSRSWSAEQGKENKRKSLAAYPPPHPPHEYKLLYQISSYRTVCNNLRSAKTSLQA